MALFLRTHLSIADKGYGIVTAMPLEDTRIINANSTSARIIAAGIVIAFCYWASSILVTLLVAVLLAYFLDPVVTWMEEWHIPRSLGALIVVLVTVGTLVVITWALVVRVDQFGRDWPLYQKPLHNVASIVESRMESFEQHVSEISTDADAGKVARQQGPESHPVRDALFAKLSGLYEVILAATFVPFLLFFMLAAKRQVWHATMQLFPATKRTDVKETLSDVTQVLRSYVVGTAMVGLILIIASWLFFWGIGLEFPFLLALVSGLLNLVPYLGVVLSWIPPVLIGLKKFHTAGPFVGIFTVLTTFHFIANNLLVPALVGWRVRLNALALTVSLLFFGFLWGGVGLLLAIPVTAVIKVICDHNEGLQPIGRWLSA